MVLGPTLSNDVSLYDHNSVTITSTSVACVVDRVSCRLQMYVECTVYLCVTTRPSQKCPDQCDRASSNQVMVDNVLTRSYTVRSGPVSLVPTTAALATTTVVPATTPTGTISATAAPTTTASNGRICKQAQLSPVASIYLLGL